MASSSDSDWTSEDSGISEGNTEEAQVNPDLELGGNDLTDTDEDESEMEEEVEVYLAPEVRQPEEDWMARQWTRAVQQHDNDAATGRLRGMMRRYEEQLRLDRLQREWDEEKKTIFWCAGIILGGLFLAWTALTPN